MKELSAEELNKPRKRRLRKKLRVGEFQELGFMIEFHLKPDLKVTVDEALDSWIEFVESQGWAFGGGGDLVNKKIEGFVAKDGRGSLTEADRLSAEKWLSDKEWADDFHVGQLKDAWHGW